MLFLRRRWAAVVLLLLAGCSNKQPSEPIQVAHLLPLTGAQSKAAEDAEHGMLLAVEEINADDQRISGRTVVVRNIDSHDDPKLVQAEAVRLVTLNKVVAFIAGPDNRGTEELAHTAQNYSVPVVVPGDPPSGTGLDGILSLNATPVIRGEILARYTVKELKPKRMIVLTDQRDPSAVALSTAFVQEWPRNSAPKIEEWAFRNDTEQIDFASDLTKKAPAVAMFAATPGDFLKLQGRLRENKGGVTLLYGGEDLSAGVLQKPDVEAITATVFAQDGLSKKGEEFAKRYEERFHEPPSFAAAQAYDAGRLLFQTMQQAKTGTVARLREELMRVESFDSVTGKVVWKDRKAQRPVFVVRVKDGDAKVMQTIDPEDK
jgi:branched-chain amino acid transport system substrate-binding protein